MGWVIAAVVLFNAFVFAFIYGAGKQNKAVEKELCE
jgi:hypothetical protein